MMITDLKENDILRHRKSGKTYRAYRVYSGAQRVTDFGTGADLAAVAVVGQRDGADFGPARQITEKNIGNYELVRAVGTSSDFARDLGIEVLNYDLNDGGN